MPSVTIKFFGSFGIVFLLTVLGAVIIWLAYRNRCKAHLPASNALLILRLTVVILLLLIMSRPEIRWQYQKKLEPQVLIYVDNSLSMANQAGFSKAQLFERLRALEAQIIDRHLRLVRYAFDDKIEPLADYTKLKFNGLATDVSVVITDLQKRQRDANITAAILVTDGMVTRGPEPGWLDAGFEFPLHVVGIGDSGLAFDPAVISLVVPDKASAGDTITIQAEIIAQGAGPMAEVLLKRDERILARQTIPTQATNLKREVVFKTVPDSPGELIYSVVIQSDQDRNTYNNQQSGQIRILSARQHIVILNGSPNFETPFLIRTLSQLPNVEIASLLDNQGRWLPEDLDGQLRKPWHLALLIDFPSPTTNRNQVNALRQKIEKEKIPLLIIWRGTKSTDIKITFSTKPLVQEAIPAKTYESVTVTPTEVGRDHPIIHGLFLGQETAPSWNTLPPLNYAFKKVRLDERLTTLLQTENLSANPVLAVGQLGQQRIALALGVDFWRWDFMTRPVGDNRIYSDLFLGLTNWLLDSLNASLLRMTTNKRTYLLGETVSLTADVSDLKGNPLSNAAVEASVTYRSGNRQTVHLSWNGSRYRGEFILQEAGEVSIAGNASSNEQNIGQAVQHIHVDDRPVELIDVRQNAPALTLLAQRAGGSKYDLISAVQLIEHLQPKNKVQIIARELKLWHWTRVVFGLIFLLGLEWIIRRRTGYQ